MSNKALTVGYLRKLIEGLPDDTKITECDHDESNLNCVEEQLVRDAQFLKFIPGGVIEEDIEEWLEDVRKENISPLAPR